MAWDLEHQEQVGVEDRGIRPSGRKGQRGVNKKALLYAGMALVPVIPVAASVMTTGVNWTDAGA